MNGTLRALADALFAHLAEHPLPAPVSVSFDLCTPEIAVQVDLGPAVTRLGLLLAWAESLDRVAVGAWHTPAGNLHVTISGYSSGGVLVKAYGGVPYPDASDLVVLAVGESASLSLADLTALAGAA